MSKFPASAARNSQACDRPLYAIRLESAAFVFHMNLTTLRIIRSLRAACSDPCNRVLACPFKLTKPTPQTRGCPATPSRAPGHPPGACLHLWKEPDFDLLSGIRPCRSHLACAQGRELSHPNAHPGPNHPLSPDRP